ncbi:YceI family protein [Saccharomonospora sp.]|uniref:YceI family protein n=1 Tax=Saccharomonospora sp. TaxID=33913 RepID=UPI0026113D67|nr:YceI family protein [Saccharomonospora sp.]
MTTDQADITTTTPRPGRYEIDTAHSTVTFNTTHLFGLLPVRGTFTISSGTVDIAEPVGESDIRVEIDATSFRTPVAMRDKVVRSPMYLDTDRHPTITFTSQRWDGGTITGALTVRGVTKPVTLLMESTALDGDSFTVRAAARVDRTEFGVTATPGMAGRYLLFSSIVRCVRR